MGNFRSTTVFGISCCFLYLFNALIHDGCSRMGNRPVLFPNRNLGFHTSSTPSSQIPGTRWPHLPGPWYGAGVSSCDLGQKDNTFLQARLLWYVMVFGRQGKAARGVGHFDERKGRVSFSRPDPGQLTSGRCMYVIRMTPRAARCCFVYDDCDGPHLLGVDMVPISVSVCCCLHTRTPCTLRS
jgi:hypothetical protein